MFSSDKNIETIGQLVELVKHRIGLQGEYLKLEITEKTVRLITAILLFTLFSLILIAILIHVSFAIVFAMAPSMGFPAAFGIMASFYILIFVLLTIFRKSLIEKPLVRFITSLLTE